MCARALAAAGATSGSIVHNAYGYGLFTGGLGIHQGAIALGATVVPLSGGFTQRQITMLRDLRPDILTCTPSYAVFLGEALRAAGVDPGDISLTAGVFGAEPWSEGMRARIEELLPLKALDIYGLSEVIGPGVSCECVEARDGAHVNEDHFLPEIVDPNTGEVLPEGEEGVLVFTTLTKQALPLLRYWTGDVTSLSSSPCACGRTLVRMDRIKGRADDMLIVRGVNVYPTQVEAVLLRLPELTPNYRIVVTRSGTLDEAEVEIETTPEHVGDDELRSRAERLLRESIGCSIGVTLQAPGTVPRSEGGKLQRVLDRR
jgi:phenylacetate-CoA ligase